MNQHAVLQAIAQRCKTAAAATVLNFVRQNKEDLVVLGLDHHPSPQWFSAVARLRNRAPVWAPGAERSLTSAFIIRTEIAFRMYAADSIEMVPILESPIPRISFEISRTAIIWRVQSASI